MIEIPLRGKITILPLTDEMTIITLVVG
ncbi:hypothetical protein F383_17780 [Gossypium arboreum]|uniref:Uncharacterized protein n=1 Tax=Gossypium arboreum TaxID=29729 RepID=A0A0B0MD64_GOSAR|nr:hypothetical protein F383_17780 [Gossypium arboreum]